MRYSLLLGYTSAPAYSLLLKELPLSSFSLLQKLACGSVDPLKVAKLMLEQGRISEDIVVPFDEMYLQKGTQYHSGEYLGQNEDGELYKGIVYFMIVGLRKNIPLVVKAVPETSVNGSLISKNLDDTIAKLAAIGFKVRAIICDDHSIKPCGTIIGSSNLSKLNSGNTNFFLARRLLRMFFIK